MIKSTLRGRERQNGYVARNLTTHSTEAEIARMSFARLKAWSDSSRSVNSGVMSPLRVESIKFPAAPQLNGVELAWIMRAAG